MGTKQWNRIINLIRSKNVLPGGITDDDIKSAVYRAYKQWRFYQDSRIPLRKVIDMAVDGRLENSFFNEILENINRIPQFTSREKETNDDDELRSVRTRFERLPATEREAYMEQARRTLRPLYHANGDAVIFAALEFMVSEELKKFREKQINQP